MGLVLREGVLGLSYASSIGTWHFYPVFLLVAFRPFPPPDSLIHSSTTWLLVLLPLPSSLPPPPMLHHVMLTLSPSHTGKAPDTPLAQPPTSEKDAQNKTEQRGERLFPVSPARLTVHWHVDGAF